jgi:hypothetical protein
MMKNEMNDNHFYMNLYVYHIDDRLNGGSMTLTMRNIDYDRLMIFLLTFTNIPYHIENYCYSYIHFSDDLNMNRPHVNKV